MPAKKTAAKSTKTSKTTNVKRSAAPAKKSAAAKKKPANAGKKTAAAKKPAAKAPSHVSREVIGLIEICVGALLLLALSAPESAGAAGEVFKGVLTGLFGIGAFILALILVIFPIYDLLARRRNNRRRSAPAFLFMFAFVTGLAHVVSNPSLAEGLTPAEYIKALYENGAYFNGGLLGGVFGDLLKNVFGGAGAVIILALGLLVGVMVYTGISIVSGFHALFTSLRNAARRPADDFGGEDDVYDGYEDYGDGRDYDSDEETPNDENDEAKPFAKGAKPRRSGPALEIEGKTRPKKTVQLYWDESQKKERETNDKPEIPVRLTKPAKLTMPQKGENPLLASRMITPSDNMPEDNPPRAYIDVRRPANAEHIEREYPPDSWYIGDAPEGVFEDAYEGEYADDPKNNIKFSGLIEGADANNGIEDVEGDILASAYGLETGDFVINEEITPLRPTASANGGRNNVVPFSPSERKPKETALPDIAPQTQYETNFENYATPPLSLLKGSQTSAVLSNRAEILENSRKLEDTLASFRVEAKVVEVSVGPTVTRYEMAPGLGVKVSSIANLSNDLALSLAAQGIRIEAPIPGKSAVGIEIPNKETQPVLLRDILEDEEFQKSQSKLSFAVGKDISGKTVVADVAKMPHLLIAGATGSGKSVCINTLITSILYKARPDEIKLIMVDPKVVELSIYNGIPHLLIPVVTDPKKAAGALNWAVMEMDRRYNLFAEANVRDMKNYNELKANNDETDSVLPQIVIIIDELADLMMTAKGEVEEAICRLAQKARAAGLHLIVATQRPSVDVITGLIKANIPSRMAFAVSSGTDSRTVLDMVGAEKLLGKGDMLYLPVGRNKPIRVQCGFISDHEVEDIVEYLKSQVPMEYSAEMIEQVTDPGFGFGQEGETDEFFEEAVDFLISKGKASASVLQRQFRIGYNRASRLIEELEARGIVGPEDGSKPRKVLVKREEWENRG